MAIFDNATGAKYRMPFPGGSIVATDFFFNYFFSDGAFGGVTNNGKLVDVAGSTYTRREYPNGPAKTVSRSGFQYRKYSLGAGTRLDVGKNLYVKDGKDSWNFSVSGPINKWAEWMKSTSPNSRAFAATTAHGAHYSFN